MTGTVLVCRSLPCPCTVSYGSARLSGDVNLMSVAIIRCVDARGHTESLEIVPGQGRGRERITIDTANSLFLVH